MEWDVACKDVPSNCFASCGVDRSMLQHIY
jgi:hypothetical protein